MLERRGRRHDSKHIRGDLSPFNDDKNILIVNAIDASKDIHSDFVDTTSQPLHANSTRSLASMLMLKGKNLLQLQ